MRSATRTLLLALTLGAAACASSQRGATVTTDESGGEVAADVGDVSRAPAIVFVNQSLHQADVYALTRAGSRVRLGTVQSGRTDTLQLNSAALPSGGTVIIAADLLAVRATPTTGEISINPGEWLSVTLPATANILNVLPVPR